MIKKYEHQIYNYHNYNLLIRRACCGLQHPPKGGLFFKPSIINNFVYYTNMDNKNLEPMRHSCEHVLHLAMTDLYPGLKRAMGPPTEDGFYFDFDYDGKISEEDFPKIEKRMREIINKKLPIVREEISLEDAETLFKDNKYKQEWIKEIKDKGQKATVYWTGKPREANSDVDLCKGPHVESTDKIGPFKLLSVAGAYWRGSEKNKMLTRIYGTCFATKEELDKYLWQLEESKKRDHRKLGKELELFFIDEVVGKGLVMWLPKGTIIRNLIEDLAKKMEDDAGYVRVVTPHIAKEELFLTSGHLPYYKDSMYPPMVMDDGTYYLKAMNCPYHHRIFLHGMRSYRELPLRLAEYGTCYRNELSGTLSGLLRVRAMAMNDAHMYCRRDQIKSEFAGVLKLTIAYFELFGLKDYWFRLSKWDPKHTDKYINEPENWEYSEQVLREVLVEMKLPFKEAENEAAFYGPKVDVQFRSILGKEETMSTIQLDFAAKKRFNLTYIDEKGEQNNDVFVIHRAPLSVHERFLAFLLEQYAGKFPLWLAPVQVEILPVSDAQLEKAYEVQKLLKSNGIRAAVNSQQLTLGKKIRQATLQKVPYMGIMGQKEIEAAEPSLSIRTRDGKDLGMQPVASFINTLKQSIENHS